MRRAEEVLDRLADDLGIMTTHVEDAMERCRELLDIQSSMPVDVQRDAQHLFARVEATSVQLENTIRTMERLVRRLAVPVHRVTESGSATRGLITVVP